MTKELSISGVRAEKKLNDFIPHSLNGECGFYFLILRNDRDIIY